MGCVSMALQPVVGQGLLIIETSLSHWDTPQSAGFLWTSDQPDAEISAENKHTITRHRFSSPRRDSNPQSQQASGSRRTPYTTSSLGSAMCLYLFVFSDLTTVNYIGNGFQWRMSLSTQVRKTWQQTAFARNYLVACFLGKRSNGQDTYY